MNKKTFTDQDIHKQVHQFSAYAENTLKDENKSRQLLDRIKKWLLKGRNIPVLGTIIDDVVDMISLFNDYLSGAYKEIPFGAIVAIVAVLIYLISPLDLIPDWIPVIGYLDDVAVFTAVLKSGVSTELKRYRRWQNRQEAQANRSDESLDYQEP